MHQPKPTDSSEVTLINCDQEPIHIPGSIQPHGVLLVLSEEDFTIKQISANTVSVLKRKADALLGQPIGILLNESHIQMLREEVSVIDRNDQNAFLKNINPLRLTIEVDGKETQFNGIVHTNNAGMMLELEPFSEEDALSFTHFYDLSRKSLFALQSADELEELYQVAVREVRVLTGFDRVMLYQFDDEWNGDVVAESRDEEVDSYLGLHFPHTDIPAQARALYLVNWLRYIPDATYEPVPLLAYESSQVPVDLSHSILRSVSPIHLEYLANMRVQATLTISLIKDNQLWGLIACHHNSPIYLPYQMRIASEYIGQILSLQLSLKQKSEDQAMGLTLRRIHSMLIENITRKGDYRANFTHLKKETLALTNATGAAICHEGAITLIGATPSEEEVDQIYDWVSQRLDEQDSLFQTNQLGKHYAPAANFVDTAAGLLAVLIAKPQQSYILWFRREVVQEVHWGGKPDKFYQQEENGVIRLHPRKSFDLWKQRVEGLSQDWSEEHITMARELSNAIKDIFVFKAEEYRKQNEKLEQLNADLNAEVQARKEAQSALERSNAELERFAYIASHDLKEPLRTVSSFSMLLKKRYGEQLDERADKYIRFIVDGTTRMQMLIDDILTFSRLERKGNRFEEVDIDQILKDVKSQLETTIKKTRAKINYQDLPTLIGDRGQLTQLFQNLISNSLKYRKPDIPPEISIRSEEQKDHWKFCISDNGIGIEKEFFGRIFVIFQRLHSASEYEGTGIGLAICQRVVETHHGEIWVESKLNEGSSFYFTISKALKPSE
jgi:chemotaxis family two-component system sensor kinase Cph1